MTEASEQTEGFLGLPYVDCDDEEEAIGSLFCSCRSSDEREISVGGDIVACTTRKDDGKIDSCNDNDDGHDCSLEIRRFLSKKH